VEAEVVQTAAPIPVREVLAVVELDQILVRRETLVIILLSRAMLAVRVQPKQAAAEVALLKLVKLLPQMEALVVMEYPIL
jgi:hypothetical protein